MVTVPHPASRSVMDDISDAFTGLAAIFAGDEPGAADSKPADEAGMASNQEDDYSDVSDAQLRLLLERQREHCARALRELRRDGEKTGHWAWWAFPTEREGIREPRPPTRVTPATAPVLLERAPRAWREALEEVARLVEAHDITVLPRIDFDRVRSFCRFWRSVDASPAWLLQVIATLDVALQRAPGPDIPALAGSVHVTPMKKRGRWFR